jgi:hypothetical protein
MKTHSEEQFLKWAEAQSMVFDEDYPAARTLTFKRAPNLNRFWVVPQQPEQRPYFLAGILDLMGKWQSCRAWRHMGRWPERPGRPRAMKDRVEFQILKGIGMPMGTDDIVEFSRRERDQLATLLFSTTVFGWSIAEDLYVVPDHAEHIIRTDHHGVVWMHFRQLEDLQQSVKKMNRRGYPLPKAVPDWTFTIPEWMGKE